MAAPSTHDSAARPDVSDGTPSDSHTVMNWTLAVLSLLGAAAVVGFAYMRVMGTAACTTGVCETPSETTFAIITYGAPILAVLTVVASLFTAKQPRGILVPLFTWAALVVAFVVLMVTF